MFVELMKYLMAALFVAIMNAHLQGKQNKRHHYNNQKQRISADSVNLNNIDSIIYEWEIKAWEEQYR